MSFCLFVVLLLLPVVKEGKFILLLFLCINENKFITHVSSFLLLSNYVELIFTKFRRFVWSKPDLKYVATLTLKFTLDGPRENIKKRDKYF